MMNWQAKISDKDMMLLSEYLDDVLSIQDRAKFEKRLQKSSELKEALEDMTVLKHSMRSLPSKPLPHQFTLTRNEAEKARRGRFLLPTFGWASAVCMILLAVIFGSEFIYSSFSVPQTVSAPFANTLQSEVAPESPVRDTESASGQPVYLLNWVSAGGKGGGGSGSVAYGVGGGGVVVQTAPDTAIAEPMQSEGITPRTEVEIPSSDEKLTVEPLIFGVREDQLGQVITIEPDEIATPAVAAAREAVEPEKEPIIPANVKFILLGLAAAFGLIWLLLRLRR